MDYALITCRNGDARLTRSTICGVLRGKQGRVEQRTHVFTGRCQVSKCVPEAVVSSVASVVRITVVPSPAWPKFVLIHSGGPWL